MPVYSNLTVELYVGMCIYLTDWLAGWLVGSIFTPTLIKDQLDSLHLSGEGGREIREPSEMDDG